MDDLQSSFQPLQFLNPSLTALPKLEPLLLRPSLYALRSRQLLDFLLLLSQPSPLQLVLYKLEEVVEVASMQVPLEL
jgi:hypothetical protein